MYAASNSIANIDNSADLIKKHADGLSFYLLEDWRDSDLGIISSTIRSSKLKNSNSANEQDGLSGRGVISFVSLPGIGCVAVKQYRRGGLVSLLIKERYLKQSRIRPERELAILREAQSLGINVPRPLGYVTQGRLFYKAWLLTQEIPSHKSLSEISRESLLISDPAQLVSLISKLVAQVSILIAARIHHVDLHPGNTVVSGDNKIYILDFDKATKVDLEPKVLRDMYLVRWRRAVIKHKLPEILSEVFCLGLRRSAIVEP